MDSNYYVVLGISPDANLPQIRRAFRKLCHECHPDRDVSGAERFILLKEAYDTLANPAERKAYDQRLGRSRPQRPSHVVAESPVDLFRDFERYTPSAEEIRDLFNRQFTHKHEPKAKHPRDVNIEMVLSHDEAVRGGTLSLAVPLLEPCDTCEGTGRAGLGVCEVCEGRGSEQFQAQLDVIIPPRTADGTIIPVSLKHLGIENLYLKVHLRVR